MRPPNSSCQVLCSAASLEIGAGESSEISKVVKCNVLKDICIYYFSFKSSRIFNENLFSIIQYRFYFFLYIPFDYCVPIMAVINNLHSAILHIQFTGQLSAAINRIFSSFFAFLLCFSNFSPYRNCSWIFWDLPRGDVVGYSSLILHFTSIWRMFISNVYTCSILWFISLVILRLMLYLSSHSV